MKVTELCDAIDAQIEVLYHPNQNFRWSAKFKGGEIIQDGCLISSFGNGKTPQEAVENYAAKIRGKRICFGAFTANRREFVMPKELEL